MISFIESGYTSKAEYEAALKEGRLVPKANAAIGVVIGTHSGAFQADEALGVWLLRRLEQFGGASAPVIRSRDMKVLEPLTIVIDVAGTYDHTKLRYDHHQRGFFGASPVADVRIVAHVRQRQQLTCFACVCAPAETFDGKVGVATGPDNATGEFKTKLSASGLVYKHYGRDILCALHPSLADAPGDLEWVYRCAAYTASTPRRHRRCARADAAHSLPPLWRPHAVLLVLSVWLCVCTAALTVAPPAHARGAARGVAGSCTSTSWRRSTATTTASRSPT